MKVFRIRARFDAFASFDIEAPTPEDAALKGRKWIDGITDTLVDVTIEHDDKRVHVEDCCDPVTDVTVEGGPYEPEDPCPSA